MYSGEWGQKLVEAVRSEGGKMTLEDLERYEPVWSSHSDRVFETIRCTRAPAESRRHQSH